ncbi:ISAs1 family transposase [Streptomyces sp. NPDC101455]|uniref:ISAs1 family transposase n=1 Tax=Streptomyces sp. NPDC101455 TaxID=3366142 RepID=UPI003811B18F
MCRQSASVCLVKSPTRRQRDVVDLAERLRTLPDPRLSRGVRRPFVSVLLVACSAAVAGACSFAALGQWAASAPQDTLARLGARVTTVFGVRVAPSGATVRRLIIRVCPRGLADLPGRDPTGANSLAVDGKTARGSRTSDSPAAHLLAAITDAGQTVTQLRVPGKMNENTCFAALLAPYELKGITVTADALHTQRDHARHLVEDRGAHYAFTMKLNQPTLYAQLKALPWDRVKAKHYDRSSGHGRLETRVVQVLTVIDLGLSFPHAAQVARIVRHRTDRKTGRRGRETVYVLTDLTSRQASPQRIAEIIRAQWVIENRLHFVRDTTFGSFAINHLRDAGHTNIAAALRAMSYEPFVRPLDLLKIG